MPALEYDTSSLSQIQTTLSLVKMPANFNNEVIVKELMNITKTPGYLK